MATAAIAAGSLALSAYQTYKAGQDSDEAKRAGAAASKTALYNPDSAAFQDKNAAKRRGQLTALGQRAGQEGFRTGQERLADLLEKRATGEAPSLSELQLQQGLEQAQGQALGLAQASGQGGLGFRQALQAQGQLAGQAQQQAAITGLQEQQQATGALGNLFAQGRQGDLGQTQGLLAIQAQQAQEDERNRQALINRERIIASGRQAAAGVGQSAASNLALSARQGQARASNLASNALTKGFAPALSQLAAGSGGSSAGTGGVVGNIGYTPTVGPGSTTAQRRG